MAAGGPNEMNPNWPLPTQNPVSSVTSHTTSPPPRASSRENMIQATSQMPKRRPLSSTAANLFGRQHGQPLSPTHGNSASEAPPVVERKASFEEGDDAFMRQPGSHIPERLNLGQENFSQKSPISNEASPVTQSIPYGQRQPLHSPKTIIQSQSSIENQSISYHQRFTVDPSSSWQKPLSSPVSPSIPNFQRQAPDSPNTMRQLQPSAENQSTSYHQRPTVESPTYPPKALSTPVSPLVPSFQRQTPDPPATIQQQPLNSPMTQSIPYRQRQTVESSATLQQPQSAVISSANENGSSSRHVSGGSVASFSIPEEPQIEPLHYHHQPFDTGNRRTSGESFASKTRIRRTSAEGPPRPASHGRLTPANNSLLGAGLPRPTSAYSSGSEGPRRTLSPGQQSNGRTPSPSRHSPDNRLSYVDLLNVPYPQPPPASSNLDNTQLRSSVGENASLLSTKKTLEMYRANAKKTNDATIQYEFAIFMVNTAQETAAAEGIDIHSKPPRSNTRNDASEVSSTHPSDLLREARHTLQKLSDRSYPFAQYYLGDGYASGLFSKGHPDNDRAFPLFISASKHGHAEAGYRAALCYEFGWGSRKDFQKAVQFYRQSASKNHPGAMSRLGRACLVGDLGLGNRYREGVKWLKRAAESADPQYNSAPYELGLLHETGHGDDIFRDEGYAAQLFTQSADLGHVEANYRLGDAYEHGKLSCPRDPALSVHFYTGAAQRGHALAMMALCAWYMVGAEPVLEKDEGEAYEWARKAAESGLPKAEYAVGYFTEMGIGCRRDPLEANVWYVKAADQGDERAKHRIAAIRAAASGGSGGMGTNGKLGDGGTSKEKKKWGLF